MDLFKVTDKMKQLPGKTQQELQELHIENLELKREHEIWQSRMEQEDDISPIKFNRQ